MAQTGGGGYEAADQLAKVADLLRQENTRQSFEENARGTLDAAGVDMGMLPPSLVDMLAEMSPEELGLISRMCDSLVEAGLYVEGPDGGRVCFF